MAFEKQWNEAIPPQNESVGQGASRIREFKSAIRERLAVDHNFKADETGDNDIGKHKQVQLIEKTSDPDNPTSGIVIYDKNGKLYIRKKTGDPVEIVDDTDQTIYGVKTFNSLPVLPATDPTNDNEAVRKRYVDENFVDKSSNQIIGGIKTFTSIPILPNSDPTNDNQAVRKAYVDNKVASNTPQIMIVVDEKPSGTSGGAFTSGDWRTRDLNTVKYNTISGASLSNNRITLPAGTYYIEVVAPAYRVDRHKAKLKNITDNSDVLIGSSAASMDSGNVFSYSVIKGIFTISDTKTFEIQHRCSQSNSTNGFGIASSFDVPEVYTQVFIQKIG